MKVTNEHLLDIITEASYRLHSEIKIAYKAGKLEEYLKGVGMTDLYPCEEPVAIFDTYPEGKIVIIGESKMKDVEIHGCLKEYGLERDRVELYIGYERAKSLDLRTLQYNPNYRLILCGPVPHSGEMKEDKSSILTKIENTDGYPKTIRLTDSHGLKLTKASLRRVIEREIHRGYLAI